MFTGSVTTKYKITLIFCWHWGEPKDLCQNITYLENNALDALGLFILKHNIRNCVVHLEGFVKLTELILLRPNKKILSFPVTLWEFLGSVGKKKILFTDFFLKTRRSDRAWVGRITCIWTLGSETSKTDAKNIHLKMLSATGRTTLPVHSFCPPPVVWVGIFVISKGIMVQVSHLVQNVFQHGSQKPEVGSQKSGNQSRREHSPNI